MVIAFVAFWAALAGSALGRATVGLAASLLGAAFLLIEHFQRFLLLALADRYGAADEAHRAGLGAAATLGENLSQTADMAFNALLGTGLVFFALALTRHSKAHFLVWFTGASGALCLLTAVLSAIDWRLGFISFPALILFALWTVALGAALWRGGLSQPTAVGG